MNFGSFLYMYYGSDASNSEKFAKAGVWGIAVTNMSAQTDLKKKGRWNHAIKTSKAMVEFLAEENVAALVPKAGTNGTALRSVPNNSRKGIFVSPWQLSLEEDAKWGKWPSNYQIKSHFGSILDRGLESDREPIDIRFHTGAEPHKDVALFSIGYVDGHARGLMSQLVFGLLMYLDSRMQLS